MRKPIVRSSKPKSGTICFTVHEGGRVADVCRRCAALYRASGRHWVL
jgi:hypothetical protein